MPTATLWRVELTPAEHRIAVQAGRGRHALHERHGTADSPRVADEVGAVAECAVALALGLPWAALEDPRAAADVGEDVEVRASVRAGHLYLTPADRSRSRFVLAQVEARTVALLGWLAGWEAKRAEWWHEGRWLVPVGALHPMDSLTPA